MKNKQGINLLVLHIIVLIWGLTGILGYEISLDAFPLVWWRVVIAVVAIFIFALLRREKLIAPTREIMKFALIGLLTAAHWICFFGSIKASKISVTLVVISTTAFFVALLSPLVRKEKHYPYELFLGAVVITGLLLIFKFENEYQTGILLSLMAAIFAALFSSFNSVLVQSHQPTKIAFWEMLFAAIGLTIFLAVRKELSTTIFETTRRDFYLLLFLGVICTGVAFIVSIHVMKVLSPFTCALAINMEPVYTIVIALFLYGESEFMSPQFYLGAVIIVSTLFIDAWLKMRKQKIEKGGT